ncbi:hypothetical protein Tco_0677622 [Tanacetum coccineum]|uniref:Uncharacterized protein n=1 Tax=Tanacetum coccineum TaxID=301880 RepID=A0ABQ4XCR0_9ASTR
MELLSVSPPLIPQINRASGKYQQWAWKKAFLERTIGENRASGGPTRLMHYGPSAQAYKNPSGVSYKLVYGQTKSLMTPDQNRVFNIGDLSPPLLIRLRFFFGKLKSRWNGPFTSLGSISYDGTVELSQANGANFKGMVIASKHYFGRERTTIGST